MQPFIDVDGEAHGPDLIVACPVCGSEDSHHDDVLIFSRMEDGPTTVYCNGSVIDNPPENPSLRREAVRILFMGECGHFFSLDVIQHKGQTVLSIVPSAEAVTR